MLHEYSDIKLISTNPLLLTNGICTIGDLLNYKHEIPQVDIETLRQLALDRLKITITVHSWIGRVAHVLRKKACVRVIIQNIEITNAQIYLCVLYKQQILHCSISHVISTHLQWLDQNIMSESDDETAPLCDILPKLQIDPNDTKLHQLTYMQQRALKMSLTECNNFRRHLLPKNSK